MKFFFKEIRNLLEAFKLLSPKASKLATVRHSKTPLG